MATLQFNLRSVRHKLLAGVLITSLAALLVTGIAMVTYDLRSYYERQANDLSTQADIIGRTSAVALKFDDRQFASNNLALLNARPEIKAAAIYHANGGLFASHFRADSGPADLPAIPEPDGIKVNGESLEVYRRIVDGKEILGTVYLNSYYGFYERLWSYLAIVIGVSALALTVSWLLSSWLQASVTKPILDITGVARHVIESRDFTLRAKKTTEDEIGYLVSAFNDMLVEIERQTEAQRETNLALVAQVEDRRKAEAEVHRLNSELEERVERRTMELEATNKELESFSYSVSHDLRAPLRAVDGYAQMLEEDHGERLDDDGRRMLAIVRQEAIRMGRLIDDLLAFSKLGRNPLDATTTVDMTAMAREVAEELLGNLDRERVRLDVWPLPPVKGERALLRQVWVNLISNALKYSGGQPRSEILITGEVSANEATYRVADNGVGFDMKFSGKLFNVFQRLHRSEEFEGTGVGLAIVQRIVARHGGRVRADSKIGQGATFFFSLPAMTYDE